MKASSSEVRTTVSSFSCTPWSNARAPTWPAASPDTVSVSLSPLTALPPRLGHHLGQQVSLWGGHLDGLAGGAGDELLDGAVGEEPTAADHDQAVGGVLRCSARQAARG
jgi:hypothetical protein